MKKNPTLTILISTLMIFDWGCSQSGAPQTNAQSTPAAPVSSQTNTQTTPAASTTSSNPDINVTLDYSIENLTAKKPRIVGKTNLPDGTKIMCWIKGLSFEFNSMKSAVVQNGTFKSEEFSNENKNLQNGKYQVTVSTPMSAAQDPEVREKIGPMGEKLKGDLVTKRSEGYFVVESIKGFEIK